MKFSNIVLSLIVLGTVSLVTAQELEGTSIDAEIAAIQAAPAQERVELMNQLKQKLANMNEADRMSAIEQLQTKMHANKTDATQHSSTEMAQTHLSMHTHVQEMQTQIGEHMNQMQSMNQHQAGNHFMHMPESTGGMPNPAPIHNGGASNNAPTNMNNFLKR